MFGLEPLTGHVLVGQMLVGKTSALVLEAVLLLDDRVVHRVSSTNGPTIATLSRIREVGTNHLEVGDPESFCFIKLIVRRTVGKLLDHEHNGSMTVSQKLCDPTFLVCFTSALANARHVLGEAISRVSIACLAHVSQLK